MFMLKSTHRRLIQKQGEAYRWEIKEKQSEIDALKRTLTKHFDTMVPTLYVEDYSIPYNNWRLLIEIDARHLREKLPQELLQMLSQRIMERLHGFN